MNKKKKKDAKKIYYYADSRKTIYTSESPMEYGEIYFSEESINDKFLGVFSNAEDLIASLTLKGYVFLEYDPNKYGWDVNYLSRKFAISKERVTKIYYDNAINLYHCHN